MEFGLTGLGLGFRAVSGLGFQIPRESLPRSLFVHQLAVPPEMDPNAPRDDDPASDTYSRDLSN